MELGSYIDHTKLGFTVTTKQVEKLCEEAREYHFASVCVHNKEEHKHLKNCARKHVNIILQVFVFLLVMYQ